MKEVTGIIDHRILLNYRIDPEVMKKNLPAAFKPKIVNGYAVGGICQVSLSGMRPKGLPAVTGTRSHNAAHRIAVVASKGEGVYVPRRDTNSWLNTFSGGRLFPGVYSRTNFKVIVEDSHYIVDIKDQHGKPLMYIDATVTDAVPPTSIFKSVEEVSAFFEKGNIGWSDNQNENGFDAIELKTIEWRMEPLKVSKEFSAFFTNTEIFPEGSAVFDCAMIMRNLKHSWISRDNLCDICS